MYLHITLYLTWNIYDLRDELFLNKCANNIQTKDGNFYNSAVLMQNSQTWTLYFEYILHHYVISCLTLL